VVTRQNEHVVIANHIDEIQILIDGIGCPAVPVRAIAIGIRRQHKGSSRVVIEVPGAAVADVPIQFQRLVLGQDTNRPDAGMTAVAQGKINDAVLTTKEQPRLGLIFRQDTEAAAFAACQDHGQTIRFSHTISSSRRKQLLRYRSAPIVSGQSFPYLSSYLDFGRLTKSLYANIIHYLKYFFKGLLSLFTENSRKMY
jgi:hypothetical protein